MSEASQRSLHNAPIFRLLLKVAVNGTHQCDFCIFAGRKPKRQGRNWTLHAPAYGLHPHLRTSSRTHGRSARHHRLGRRVIILDGDPPIPKISWESNKRGSAKLGGRTGEAEKHQGPEWALALPIPRNWGIGEKPKSRMDLRFSHSKELGSRGKNQGPEWTFVFPALGLGGGG